MLTRTVVSLLVLRLPAVLPTLAFVSAVKKKNNAWIVLNKF